MPGSSGSKPLDRRRRGAPDAARIVDDHADGMTDEEQSSQLPVPRRIEDRPQDAVALCCSSRTRRSAG